MEPAHFTGYLSPIAGSGPWRAAILSPVDGRRTDATAKSKPDETLYQYQ